MPARFVEDLSSPALERFLKTCDTAVVPIGSIETHGPHLSLCADPLAAGAILRKAAPMIDADILILPMIHYAIVCQHGFDRAPAYPGNYGVREETLTRYLVDIARCLDRDGIRKLVFYNGHGGNSAMLNVARVDIEKELPDLYCFSYFVTTGMDIAGLFPGEKVGHGCAFETSLNLELCPDHTWLETNPPAAIGNAIPLEHAQNLSYFPDWVFTTAGYGYCGDPKHAAKEKGAELLRGAIEQLVPTFEELAGLDVSQLKQREKPNQHFN